MIVTNSDPDIKLVRLKIDSQLSEILITASDLYSQIEALIDSKKYNREEYPGNALDQMFGNVGDIMCKLGDIIGRDIASQAFDLCKNEKGGQPC